jgi:hypothetical protein
LTSNRELWRALLASLRKVLGVWLKLFFAFGIIAFAAGAIELIKLLGAGDVELHEIPRLLPYVVFPLLLLSLQASLGLLAFMIVVVSPIVWLMGRTSRGRTQDT